MLRSTLVKRLQSRRSLQTFRKIGDISFPHAWHFSLLERERWTKTFHLFGPGLVGQAQRREAQQRWWGKKEESCSVLLQMLVFTRLTILAWTLRPEHRVELLLKNGCSWVPIFTSNPPPQKCFWTQPSAPSAPPSAFSLTSEVEEAQMMADNLLWGFLCTEFDSAGEEDVSSPPCDEWMVLPRCRYVRHMYDGWKGRGLRTVGQSQVPHRGTFQRCI